LNNLGAKVILIPIVWTVIYVVCVYPVSFLNGLVWGFTLKIALNYMVAQHPESPFQIVIATMTVLLNVALATFVTVKIYRRFWPDNSN